MTGVRYPTEARTFAPQQKLRDPSSILSNGCLKIFLKYNGSERDLTTHVRPLSNSDICGIASLLPINANGEVFKS
jgi:hypothetical protein